MTRYDGSTSVLQSASQDLLNAVATVFGTAQAASSSALIVGAGAVLATSWLDHACIGTVMTDPSRLHHCLTIAAAAAALRSMVYYLRGESFGSHVMGIECGVVTAPGGGPALRGASPSHPSRTS